MPRSAGGVRASGGSTVDWSVPLPPPSTGLDHSSAVRRPARDDEERRPRPISAVLPELRRRRGLTQHDPARRLHAASGNVSIARRSGRGG
ncbi:hypothetical protein ABTZ99_29600 [Actinosynnema sp. NPDC002837]